MRGTPLPAFTNGSVGEVYVAPVTGPALDLCSGYRNKGAPKERRHYSLDPADWLAHVCAVVRRDLSEREWAAYLPDTPWRPTCTDLPAG